MRILMIAACPLPWPRGTPIRIHRMAEALVELGHDVHMVTYPLGQAHMSTSYRIYRVGRQRGRLAADPGPSLGKFVLLDPLLVRKIRQLLREVSFDVIHAHHYEGLIAALLGQLLRRRVPVVYDAHTLLASELPYYRLPMTRKRAARVGHWFDSRLPRRADHVIAVTADMRDWLTTTGNISTGRVTLIPNGVEHEHFAPPLQCVSNDSRPDSTARIVFTGNLAEYQGIDLLLQAFERVRTEIDGASLVLVTDSDRQSLTQQIRERDWSACVSVVHADYADLPARLAAADVLVNPRPQCAGIPQKLLNYMASGRPIVTFAGSAALLEHERTALVVSTEDVGAFAQAIIRVLQDPELARRLGQAARAQVIASHGWQQVAGKVADVYTKITGIAAALVNAET